MLERQLMGLDPAASVPTDPEGLERSPLRGRDGTSHGLAHSAVIPVSAMLALAGGAMQGYANGTLDALFASMLLLVMGYVVVRLTFPNGRAEHRAYLLTYSVGVLGGGLAQCYSLAKFGGPQSFVDAIGFYNAIFDRPPYYSWEEVTTLWIDGKEVGRGAPLAVVIWQWAYHLRLLAGLEFGIYFGVMFNALVMGLTASVTVRTARELFGDDPWRLRRVGTLFAFCGLFILFSSILLRDCFTTFFNTLVLFAIVRWLVRPTSARAAWAAMLTAISLGAMMYLRSRTVVLFGVFWLLGCGCWYFEQRLNFSRILASVVTVVALLFGSVYVIHYFQASLELQSKHMEQYSEHLEGESQQDSLGMRLVINQPLPIRLVMGTGSLMIFPIPLWAGVRSGADEYHLFKGYHAFYQFFTLPLVLAGFLFVARRLIREPKKSIPLVFLALYLLFNVLAVVATSMEQRHVAQFMPAFMILAAIPDTRIAAERFTVRQIACGWWGLVVFIHLVWFAATLGR